MSQSIRKLLNQHFAEIRPHLYELPYLQAYRQTVKDHIITSVIGDN